MFRLVTIRKVARSTANEAMKKLHQELQRFPLSAIEMRAHLHILIMQQVVLQGLDEKILDGTDKRKVADELNSPEAYSKHIIATISQARDILCHPRSIWQKPAQATDHRILEPTFIMKGDEKPHANIQPLTKRKEHLSHTTEFNIDSCTNRNAETDAPKQGLASKHNRKPTETDMT